MDEKKHLILAEVIELFKRYGIKSQTMDDIARHLAVSKKTLYKYFKDKNDLVEQSLEWFNKQDMDRVNEIAAKSLDAIEESFEISRYVTQQLNGIHPSVMYDLEKYHPNAKRLLDKHLQEDVYQCVCDNLKKGVDAGLYRKDIVIPLIAGLYVTRLNNVFTPGTVDLTKYSFQDMYLELFRYHIRGIASKKGIEKLKEKVKKEKSLKDVL